MLFKQDYFAGHPYGSQSAHHKEFGFGFIGLRAGRGGGGGWDFDFEIRTLWSVLSCLLLVLHVLVCKKPG